MSGRERFLYFKKSVNLETGGDRMKRIVTLLLVMVLCLGLAASVSAETYNGVTGECAWTFDPATGVLTISGSGNMGTGAWDEHKNDIKIVVIDDGVTSISNYAFASCTNLMDVNIGKSVTEIGNYAFAGCSEMKKVIYLGEREPQVPKSAFKGCVPSVLVPANYSSDTFGGLSVTKHVTCTITVSAYPAASGMISGGGTYESGESVTVTAMAKEDYEFVNWTEDDEVLSTAAAYTFTANANRNLVANFALKKYSVTVENGICDKAAYSKGEVVSITSAAPAAGMKFVGWTSNDVTFTDASAAETTFTMPPKAVSVKANYEAIDYTVTVGDDGNGTASATPASGNMGTEVTLTATPKEGYAFKEWQVVSGDVTIADNKFTLSTENVEVKAIFERIPVLPKFDAPLEDTVVEVMEGQAVQMSVVCANADSYQWFVDYGDGRGWQMIGDGKATYTGAPVKLENDGYRYYCCATNGDGSTNSAVFTLKVMALPKTDDLPKTGDISRLALWLCLLGIAGAAAWLRRRAYR